MSELNYFGSGYVIILDEFAAATGHLGNIR